MKNPSERWCVNDLAKLYDRIDADWLVNLDFPPLPSDCPDTRSSKYHKTLENLKYLLARFEERLIPVIHGACLTEIVCNAERIRELSSSFLKIGVGGLVPYFQRSGSIKKPSSSSPQTHIVNAISVARSVFPEADIHVFGAGSVHTVLAVLAAGANSTDSIGWRQAAGLGSVFLPGKHRRLLTDRDTAKPCRPRVSEEDKAQLRQCPCPGCQMARMQGDQLVCMSSDFSLRSLHNIWVLYQEVWEYAASRKTGRSKSFLSERLSGAWIHALEAAPLQCS